LILSGGGTRLSDSVRVGDHDASFCQQVFDVTEAQCEPEIEPDRLLDDLWRKAVAAIADFLHSLGYRTASGTASSKYRDSALTSLRSRAAFIGCRSFECRSRYDVKAPEIIGHSVSVLNCGGNAHAYERPRCAKVRISAFATLTLLIYTPLLLRMHVAADDLRCHFAACPIIDRHVHDKILWATRQPTKISFGLMSD